MLVSLRFAVVSSIVFAGMPLAAEPFGPVGTLGPAGAPARTCDGVSACAVMGSSDQWQSAIVNAGSGTTVLLRGGIYDPSGTLRIPSGVTVANFNKQAATITGPISFGGSNSTLEGLTVRIGNEAGFGGILIDSRTSLVKAGNVLAHLDVAGATGETIRVRGNVTGLVLRDSVLDGQNVSGHTMKVLCDNNSGVLGGSCNWLPEVTITNNRFERSGSSGGEDLLQFDGAGDAVVTHNEFTNNPNGEDCVDWKAQGAPGTSIVFSHNLVHGCNFEGILFHQGEQNGSTVIEGNRFEGGGNLLRRVHAGTQVINNVFNGPLTVSASNITISHNTFTSGFKFGDATQGAPQNLTIVDNIFDGTHFSCSSTGCGSYSATRNVIYQTSGNFKCASCLSTSPMLSEYKIQEGSSAQDRASQIFLVARDIDGTSRPQGSSSDIGAFEIVVQTLPSTPIVTLTANPTDIDEGQSSILVWDSTDATVCVGTGFDAGNKTSGQVTVSPAETTTYEVECDGALDSATVMVTQTSTPDDIPPSGQQPFAANVIPGIIEAEDYDLGGENVAYHDTSTGNKGGEYRADDVDIKATGDSGYTIGWGDTGEWLEWTVDVKETGDFRIRAYTGTNDTTNPHLTLSIDGAPVADVAVPNTGSWDVKQYVTVGVATLKAGSHLLRVDINQGFLDIDHFEFAAATPTPDDVTPPTVEIMEPLDGASVLRQSPTLVLVDASDDDAGVDTVTLRIEGRIVATFSGAGEHTYSWRPLGKRHRQAVLEAIAVDLAGNKSSHEVTVTVTR